MTDSIQISVIIPIYNSEKTLYRCLKSIKEQTYKNLEVIMIDDGSTDNSKDICREFENDLRFTLYEYTNAGVGTARNRGIENSNGQLLSFVDSDDYLSTDYYMNFMENYDDTIDYYLSGVIYENYSRIRPRSRHEVHLPYREMDKDTILMPIKDFRDTFMNGIPEPVFGAPYGKLFDANIVKNNQLRFEIDHNLAEDLVFNIKYVHYVEKTLLLSTASYYYRMYIPGSLSRKHHSYGYTVKRWNQVVEMCDEVCGNDKELTYHIKDIAKKNILLAIFTDDDMNYKKKKECFFKWNHSKMPFLFVYFRNIVTIYAKFFYKIVQNMIYEMNINR